MRPFSHIWNRSPVWGVASLLLVCKLAVADDSMSPLAAACNADGRLELFQVDFDGEVCYRWQRERNGDWSPWSILGGAFLPGIAVGPDVEGRLEVFAIDQKRSLNCIRQMARDGHGWSKWNDLGGLVDPPVVMAQDADGRLEVFAIETVSRQVKHLWQTNAAGDWSNWGDVGSGPAAGLTVATNQDGRLELFGVDEGRHLVHCYQRRASESSDWSAWASLGGEIFPGLGVGQNDDGQLEVFAVSTSHNEVQRIVQESAGDSARWRPWTNFGGDVKPGVVLAQNADGRLEIFAVKNGSTGLQHRFQVKRHGDDWMPWRSMDGAVGALPVAGRNHDGTLEIFAIDEHNGSEVNHRRQIIANYHWLYWSSMDRPQAQYTPRVWQTDEGLPNNRVQAIAQTGDGYLWVGTFGGLARFDGLQFKTFDDAAAPRLKNASITALCADTNDALWIGTAESGVAHVWQNQFTNYTSQDGLAGNSIRAIKRSRDGSIWIATTQGLSRLSNGRFQNYTTREGLLSDAVTALCEDRKSMWIATTSGLNLLRAGVMEKFTASNILAESLQHHWTVRPGAMDAFAATNGLDNDSIRSLVADKTHRLWIGSDYGLMWYDSGSFYSYTTLYGLSDNFVRTYL